MEIKMEGLAVSSGLGTARALSKTALTLTSTEAVHDFFREKQREIL